MNIPRPHRNSSEVVDEVINAHGKVIHLRYSKKACGSEESLLGLLSDSPMNSETKEGGFTEPRLYIPILEYFFILPFVYEAGAILGRARRDKMGILRKILLTTSESEADIEEVLDGAKGRLERYKQDSGREPQTFKEFILNSEVKGTAPSLADSLSKSAGEIKEIEELLQVLDTKVSPEKVKPYIRMLMLEGIGFGSLFPELTEKMNKKFYDSRKIDWDTWIPRGVKAPLALPKDIFALPGEPTILSLEGQEKTLLQFVGDYAADSYPELIDSLDLRHYQDEHFMGYRRYAGWWHVYNYLQGD